MSDGIPNLSTEQTSVEAVRHHALIVDADGAVEFLAKHPGWNIFPGRIERDNGRWVKLPAKGLSWTQAASDDPNIVRGLWDTYGTLVTGTGGVKVACVAVHVGKSGLLVLDQDKDLTDSEIDESWRTILATKASETLTLRSCTRQMPHYVFRQRDGHLVLNQLWPGGEAKAQNGYIFVSDLEPLNDTSVKVVPQEITDKLDGVAAPGMVGGVPPLGEYGSTVKMSDRDLEVWLATTECKLEPSQEDALVSELCKKLEELADDGHRRDAMRATCLTLAIEATAGLYGAQKAWDAIEETYRDLRDDPVRNKGVTGKAWSSRWWTDARTMLAGAVEKIEAGRYDDAINEKRERFFIWTDSEHEDLLRWVEQATEELEEELNSRRAPSVETDRPPVTSGPPTPASRPTAAELWPRNDGPGDPQNSSHSEIHHDPETGSGDESARLTGPEEPSSPPKDHNKVVGSIGARPDIAMSPVEGGVDPHAKLREEVAKLGADLSIVARAVLDRPEGDDPLASIKLAEKVRKQRENKLVRDIAKAMDSSVVAPSDWSWLVDGGYDAIAERMPGSFLRRTDGEGLIYDRGCVHLIGDKSTGKSWLCAKLAVERLLANEVVVWLDYETDEQQAAERLVQAGAPIEKIISGMKYFSMKGESIAAAVTAIGQMEPIPTVMVVDSVDASMASFGSEDENSSSGYHAWRAAIAPLTEMMVTVLIEHTGHDNSHRARGASAKGQQADQEFSAKVIKPFSKAASGLVEWTCRKNRRGGTFTTDDVAGYLKIDPAGRVRDSHGNPTPIDNAVRMTLVPPGDPAVVSVAISAEADSLDKAMKVAETWVLKQHAAEPDSWWSRRTLQDQTGLSAGDVKVIVDGWDAAAKITMRKDGRWPLYKWLG